MTGFSSLKMVKNRTIAGDLTQIGSSFSLATADFAAIGAIFDALNVVLLERSEGCEDAYESIS